MSSSRALVRVPASTSNLGPGFDCLGLAVGLHNTALLTRSGQAVPPRGMIAETAAAFFQQLGGGKLEPFPFEAKIEGGHSGFARAGAAASRCGSACCWGWRSWSRKRRSSRARRSCGC